MRLTRKWPEGAAAAALRDIDAVSHKKHWSSCRRQCFLNMIITNKWLNTSRLMISVLESLSCIDLAGGVSAF